STDASGTIAEARAFVHGVAAGDTVGAALLIGLAGLLVIGLLQRVLPKVPGVLVAVVLSIAAVNLFQLQDHGVSVVGGLPQGFPPLTVPSVKVSDLYLLVGGAFG